jgi:calcium permeable stress-gated cation channel
MIFVIVTFSLFYFTYLHNFLYVYEFPTDTGGLAFPRAIYQTMTGIYFAEICLFGLFFITSGARAQGVVMVAVLILTVLYQIKLQSMFDPLITYLPIDIQEELLTHVQQQKFEDGRNPKDDEEFQTQREAKQSIADTEPQGTSHAPAAPKLEKLEFETPEASQSADQAVLDEDDDQHASRWRPNIVGNIKRMNEKINLPINIPGLGKKRTKSDDDDDDENVDTALARKFTHELTHEELTALAYQHAALRARPPILWVPEDELGIARDEIAHTKRECGDEIQMTCAGAVLDEKGKIVWSKNPPDYFYLPNL